ncbi:hypothetical protein BH18ACT5_BH18ACT5_06140 [soil metagenome]
MTDSTTDDMGRMPSGKVAISSGVLADLVASAKAGHMVTARPLSEAGRSAVESAEEILAARNPSDDETVMIDWTVLRDVVVEVKAAGEVAAEATAPDEWAIEEAERVLKEPLDPPG